MTCTVHLQQGWPGASVGPVQLGVSPAERSIDLVMHDMQAVSHPRLLRVGPPGIGRLFVGQTYADDLAGLAGTEDGLQHTIRAVRGTNDCADSRP